MLYEQIVGQQEPKHRLLKMVKEERVPHALLFSGKEGCGNLPTAIAFAQHLYCLDKKETGACGVCISCNKVSKLIHPDLHLVFPIAKSKDVKSSNDLIKEFREAFLANPYLTLDGWFNEISAENKQPLIPVEEANDILKKLSYTSYEGSYKMMLIWQPEKMNAESANKLLKILEEPPEKTIFVLISNNPEQLLATIFSRVQQIPFYSNSEDEIANALVSQFKINPEVARQTAILSNGSYSEALHLLTQNEESVSFLNNFQTFMRLALKFDCGKALTWIDDNASSGREKQKQFLQYSLEVFRDSLMFNYGDKNLVRLSGQEKQFLEKFAPFVNQKNYERLVEEFNSNYYYIERNANPKILFMDLILKTNELINMK
ncbi:DNA polymerase III subunit delta' [Sphingobacteriaceae bacterium]|nr:DNA polymerase III subunit delta' [Sphingobacteriaceae bacterium]